MNEEDVGRDARVAARRAADARTAGEAFDRIFPREHGEPAYARTAYAAGWRDGYAASEEQHNADYGRCADPTDDTIGCTVPGHDHPARVVTGVAYCGACAQVEGDPHTAWCERIDGRPAPITCNCGHHLLSHGRFGCTGSAVGHEDQLVKCSCSKTDDQVRASR